MTSSTKPEVQNIVMRQGKDSAMATDNAHIKFGEDWTAGF